MTYSFSGLQVISNFESNDDYRDSRQFQNTVNAVENALKRLKSATWRALKDAIPEVHPSKVAEALERLQSQDKITVDTGCISVTRFHYGKKEVKSSDYNWTRAQMRPGQTARRGRS